MIAISGNATSWAPEAAASWHEARISSTLPRRSPAVVLTWAPANRTVDTPEVSAQTWRRGPPGTSPAARVGCAMGRCPAWIKQTEFVLRTIEERDIRFVRLWFTDVLGMLKSVAVAPAELEGAFSEGIGFDGSAIQGFARVSEADMLAKPDPATFQPLPWRGDTQAVARMFCDITLPDGSPSYADPRWVLKRTLARAADMGSPSIHTPRSSSSSSRIAN